MKLKLLVAAGAVMALAIGGCSSTSTSSSSSTTTSVAAGKQSLCTARTNLKSSVTALANPALLTGGKAGIQTALDTVKTNLDAVASSAQSTYQPQVDAVKSAVNDLETALGKFGSGSTASNLDGGGDGHRQCRHHGNSARLGPSSRVSFELTGVIEVDGLRRLTSSSASASEEHSFR